MFSIKYKIIDDIEQLKKIDEEFFEEELVGEVRGLLLLNFNNNLFGFYDEDLPKSVAEIFEELLILWFKLLNLVVHKLYEGNYVAMCYIENGSWIEFKAEGDNVRVSLMNIEQDTNPLPLIITDIPENIKYSEWDNENAVISKKEFVEEVVAKTESFIDYIRKINSALLESSSLSELVKLSDISKGFYELD